MKATDVTDVMTMARDATVLDTLKVAHRPRLLRDNGSFYIAVDLADWCDEEGMDHFRGVQLQPHTQGKIEGWRIMSSPIRLSKA